MYVSRIMFHIYLLIKIVRGGGGWEGGHPEIVEILKSHLALNSFFCQLSV